MGVRFIGFGWMLWLLGISCSVSHSSYAAGEWEGEESSWGATQFGSLRSWVQRPNLFGNQWNGNPSSLESSSPLDQLALSYWGVFTSPLATLDPVLPSPPSVLKNFLGLGYRLSPQLALSANAHWSVAAQERFPTEIRDPFLQLAHSALLNSDHWNLYLDGRTHFPVSEDSKRMQLLLGVQSVQSLTYSIPETRWTLGTNSSLRYNFLGEQGAGTDLELYLAPNLTFQLLPNLTVNLAYEIQASRLRQGPYARWGNTLTDIAPGVNWEILPNLSLNPYLQYLFAQKALPDSLTAGLMLNWAVL
jgi:hypothetical protein